MKKRMIKQKVQIILFVCVCVILTACSGAKEGMNAETLSEAVSEEVSEQIPEETSDKEEQTADVQTQTSEREEGLGTEAVDEQVLLLKEAMIAGTISEEEKAFFSEYFSQSQTYGFLHSDYSRPENVDLYPVLYNGAGIYTSDYSEEENDKYAGEFDLFKVFEEDLNELLMERIGLTNDQLTEPVLMDNTYGKPAYYGFASDTNYTGYTCVGGYLEGNRYTLASTSNFGGEIKAITVVEKMNDGKYLIKENYSFGLYDFWDSNYSDWDSGCDYGWEDGATLLDSTHSYTAEEIEDIIPAYDYFLARNEIYALHGYIFNDPVLKIYFAEKEWYLPTVEAKEFSDSVFSETEKHNLSVLQQLEER